MEKKHESGVVKVFLENIKWALILANIYTSEGHRD